MARWKIVVSGKGIRKASIDKLVEQFKQSLKGEDISVSVTDDTPPTSRADRLSRAQSDISEGKAEVECLRDELQEWYDNLPQNFQDGDKGSQLQDTIDTLEQIVDQCEEAEGASVDFPQMMS